MAVIRSSRGWCPAKEAALCWKLTLEKLHNERPLLTGPVALSVVFYLHIPAGKRTQYKNALGTPHFMAPDLSELLRFIEHNALNIVIGEEGLISTIDARKIFDRNPRTELTFKQLT